MGVATRPEIVLSAELAMRRRRFAEAIELFDRHLEETPGDLDALLKVGICHLLNRSERTFVAIHRTVSGIIAESREVPGEIARLWARYDALFKKVSATALILGAASLTGCKKFSAHKYSGGVARPVKSVTKPAPSKVEEPKQEAAQEAPAAKPTRPTFSAHRYSGGVYKRPRKPPPPAEE
jgi:hypothetical protein